MKLLPNPKLVQHLIKNKCKVAFKSAGKGAMYLMIDYTVQAKKPAAGLDLLGNSQEVFEKVASSVRKYYPNAELSSQNGSHTVVYRITSNQN
jgi:hypothetical protein